MKPQLPFKLCTSSITIVALLSSLIQCGPVYYPPRAICTEYSIPVNVTAAAYKFNGTEWADNNELTQFVIDIVVPGQSESTILSGPQNATAEYTISATFCTPRNSNTTHAKTVLIASHGFGFDRSYWSLANEPDEYNFAQFAVDQGYSVFFYDRLGIGNSTRVSGYTSQLSTQISVLTELATCIKAGQYTGSVGIPDSVALIGHSFGSIITHGVAAYAPEVIDAIILTGYGLNLSAINYPLVLEAWNIRIADTEIQTFTGQNLDYDTGYVSWVDLYANINVFFKAPYYNLTVALYSETTKSPFAILEALTAEVGPLNFPIPAFTGPVLLISGEYDFIFCAGYCPGVLHEPAASVFHASRNFESYVQPGMSHGMNFHYNATGFYGVVTGFLSENGF